MLQYLARLALTAYACWLIGTNHEYRSAIERVEGQPLYTVELQSHYGEMRTFAIWAVTANGASLWTYNGRHRDPTPLDGTLLIDGPIVAFDTVMQSEQLALLLVGESLTIGNHNSMLDKHQYLAALVRSSRDNQTRVCLFATHQQEGGRRCALLPDLTLLSALQLQPTSDSDVDLLSVVRHTADGKQHLRLTFKAAPLPHQCTLPLDAVGLADAHWDCQPHGEHQQRQAIDHCIDGTLPTAEYNHCELVCDRNAYGISVQRVLNLCSRCVMDGRTPCVVQLSGQCPVSVLQLINTLLSDKLVYLGPATVDLANVGGRTEWDARKMAITPAEVIAYNITFISSDKTISPLGRTLLHGPAWYEHCYFKELDYHINMCHKNAWPYATFPMALD